MGFLHRVADLFLHLDRTLGGVLRQYGSWTYLLLFLIVFCETGLVVLPFLPGDSLLFAVGALAAVDTSGTLRAPWVLWSRSHGRLARWSHSTSSSCGVPYWGVRRSPPSRR